MILKSPLSCGTHHMSYVIAAIVSRVLLRRPALLPRIEVYKVTVWACGVDAAARDRGEFVSPETGDGAGDTRLLLLLLLSLFFCFFFFFLLSLLLFQVLRSRRLRDRHVRRDLPHHVRERPAGRRALNIQRTYKQEFIIMKRGMNSASVNMTTEMSEPRHKMSEPRRKGSRPGGGSDVSYVYADMCNVRYVILQRLHCSMPLTFSAAAQATGFWIPFTPNPQSKKSDI